MKNAFLLIVFITLVFTLNGCSGCQDTPATVEEQKEEQQVDSLIDQDKERMEQKKKELLGE